MDHRKDGGLGRGQERVHVFGDVGRNDPLYRKTAFGLFYDTATETKHVLVKPPGDARRCGVAGVGRPSGARSGRLKQFWMCLQGFSPRTCWAGILIKASNGLARGCVGIGWAKKQVVALLRVSGDLWDGPGSEAIRN